jgi:WD40 repeat protein
MKMCNSSFKSALLPVILLSLLNEAFAHAIPDIVWRTNAHNRSVITVAFSADSAFLGSGSIDRTTKVWRVSSRSIVHSFQTEGWSSAVGFSSDISLLGVGDDFGNISIWRLADGSRVIGSRDGEDDSSYSVTFSPDSRLFASAARESGLAVGLLNPPPGTPSLPFDYPEDAVAAFDVCFSPNGTLLAAGFDDHNAKLFQMSDGTRLRDLAGHSGHVTSVDFSPDGTRLATAATDGDARLWRVSDGALERVIRGGGGPELLSLGSVALTRARFSANGKSLLTLSNGAVRFWSVSDGRLLLTYPNLEAFSLAVSPDGKHFAYGTGSAYATNAAVVLARMPLLFTDISRTNGQLILGWSGGSGLYQLQSTANVATGPWQNVGEPTTATAATNSVSATVFYRLQNLSVPP